MRPSVIRTLLTIASVLALMPACAGSGAQQDHVLRRPSIQFTFSELSDEEERLLLGRIQVAEAPQIQCSKQGDKVVCTPKMSSSEWSPSRFFGQVADLHQFVASIQNPSGSLLAQSESIHIEFNYTTTHAESVTGAVIFITPAPSEAQLFIDTPIPGLTRHLDAEGAAVVGDSGQFSIDLPFSFIRQRRHIYFRTVHQGATRYFFYDLDAQRQHEVGGVHSPEAWSHFQAHHRLP